MAASKPLPFSEQLALKQLSENEYTTIHPPQKMGNPLNIAYGGYALATACKAACLTVPAGYHLYSMLGNYLGPAYTDRQLHANVRTIRQTRTFATRQVEVSQIQDNGEPRVCLIAIADFQVKEKASLLEYSKTPSQKYANWKECATQTETYQKLVDEGKVSQQLVDYHGQRFNVLKDMYELRPCPTGIFAQNLYGVAKTLPHSQDDVASAERTTADWFRCRETLATPVEQITNLTFLIDSAIAFLPLSFNHMWFDDVAAVSSLDFALRFFQNGKTDDDAEGIDVNQWHLREMKTGVASTGRSYGESWIWDERGRAVACMSQQSILRPTVGNQRGKL